MDKRQYETKGVFCNHCGKCLSKSGKRKNPQHWEMLVKITCEECQNGKFSEAAFSLHHLGNNQWIIKDSDGKVWMGKDEWVHESSSHHAMTSSEVVIFTWIEAITFVNQNFSCKLDE